MQAGFMVNGKMKHWLMLITDPWILFMVNSSFLISIQIQFEEVLKSKKKKLSIAISGHFQPVPAPYMVQDGPD